MNFFDKEKGQSENSPGFRGMRKLKTIPKTMFIPVQGQEPTIPKVSFRREHLK